MYELKVSGMTCPSCASSLTYALRSIDPKVEVTVDITNQTVRVKSNKTQEALTSIVSEAGYPVLNAKKVA